MATYDDCLTLREARAQYFERNGFGADGGYGKPWVKYKFGPFPIFVPNTPARVRSVRYHDLHHVLTGYDTDLTGEGQIGAWELASGCAHYCLAWLLNLAAMTIGLLIAPRRVCRAFLRGRQTLNLYREPFDDALLSTPVGELRHRLRLDQVPAAPQPGVIRR